jgi:hypothetical protein
MEQRVAGEHDAEVRGVKADGTGGVPRCVQDGERGAGHGERICFTEVDVGVQVRAVLHRPQHPVRRVQRDHGVGRGRDLDRCVDVVVVPVRADDRDHSAVADCGEDLLGVMRRVDHEDLAVVADQPDVVLHLPLAAVEGERS